MSAPACSRWLDVSTHGECNKSKSQAAIAVHFWNTAYADGDVQELVPEVHKPFSTTGAGYWAIIRALKQAPWMSNVAILSEDEVCVSTIKLLLNERKKPSYGVRGHKHSHEELVDRILEDVKSRRAAGCEVLFNYASSDDRDYGWYIANVRQLAKKVLKDAAAESAAYEGVVATFGKLGTSTPST